MIRSKQLYQHRPEQGQIGDCWRTCLACLLDMPPADVPHFVAMAGMDNGEGMAGMDNGEGMRRLTLEWLARRGLSMIELPYSGQSLPDVLQVQGQLNAGVHYLLGGESRTGVNHSVVACGDQIVWDPSQTDAGIVGPMKPDGYYWLTWLVPLQMVAIEHRPAVPPQCACLVPGLGMDYCEVHAA